MRLPEEQGILTNAEEEEEQVLLEVTTRMVFDAGLQRTAEAVNDSIDIVTSCHHQEPENPKNYTLENLAHNKTRAKQAKHTNTHTHKLSSSLHNPPTTKNQKDSPSVSLASIVQDDSFVCCSRSGSKTAAQRGIPTAEKTLTANRFRIQQPNGTKWRESTKTKPKCLPAAQVTGTSAIRDRKKRNLFDSSSSSSSHSLLCSYRLLIHLSRLTRRQPNPQYLHSSPSRHCLVAILERPSPRATGRREKKRKEGRRRRRRKILFFHLRKGKEENEKKEKGRNKGLDFSFSKKKRKEKKRMRTRKKGERFAFARKKRRRNKREILFLFLLKIKEENEKKKKKPKEEERSLFVFCEKEKKRMKRQTGRKIFFLKNFCFLFFVFFAFAKKRRRE